MAQRLWIAGFWLAFGFTTYMALAPAPPDAVFEISDIILHFAAFATLTFLLSLAHFRSTLLLPAACLLLYGVVIELIQSTVAARSAEFKDLFMDSIGIGVGLLAVRLLGDFAQRVLKSMVG